ncbi:MAG: ketosteroid isomerase family protein [Cyanobacteria bacterium P01_F01_bin.33]
MSTQPSKRQPLALLTSEDEAAIVCRYFSAFNRGEFDAVTALFAEEGSLYPPFEPPIVGRDAIAVYLDREADGMEASPHTVEVHPLADSRIQVDVRGKVTALVFNVNVAWQFMLTASGEIESVRVNLLASLEELLKIRPFAASLSEELVPGA